MIGTIEIKCFAAKPQMPLPPVFAFKASPSSLRILDVPRKIGTWAITAVKVAATYPDNSIVVQEAVRTGNVWVATFTGCGVSGKTANGIQILADGTDENGDVVTGYVLGVGDLYILDRDSTIAADDSKWYVRYCDEIPATPATGDLVIDNGAVRIYDGAEWVTIETDLSAYATKQEVAEALTNKQNRLSNAQVSAIDSVVDERQTVVTYTDGTTAELDIEGTLESMSIPNIDNVAAVKIGTAVTSIGDSAFEYCSSLTIATIPDSVTSIGERAFYYCDALMSLTIGNGVTTIGESAFNTCNSLTSATIPDSVTSIGSSAFTDCYNLTSVMIGNGVTSIGANVFVWCSSLANVTFKGKSLAEVQAMSNYPWGINTSIINTWNDASKEWVGGNYLKTKVMTQAEYDAIATPDPSTMYVIVAEASNG